MRIRKWKSGWIPQGRTSSRLFANCFAWSPSIFITCSTPALLASMNAGTSTTHVSAACFKQAETASTDGRAEGFFSQHLCRLSQTLSVNPNFSESLGLGGRSPSRTTLQANSVFPLLANGGVPVNTWCQSNTVTGGREPILTS